MVGLLRMDGGFADGGPAARAARRRGGRPPAERGPARRLRTGPRPVGRAAGRRSSLPCRPGRDRGLVRDDRDLVEREPGKGEAERHVLPTVPGPEVLAGLRRDDGVLQRIERHPRKCVERSYNRRAHGSHRAAPWDGSLQSVHRPRAPRPAHLLARIGIGPCPPCAPAHRVRAVRRGMDGGAGGRSGAHRDGPRVLPRLASAGGARRGAGVRAWLNHFPQTPGARSARLAYALRARRMRAVRAWLNHFPQAPGARSTRLATRLRRGARSRAPGCYAARSLAGQASRLRPVAGHPCRRRPVAPTGARNQRFAGCRERQGARTFPCDTETL